MSERTSTPEQEEFREYCRRWLAENRPAAPSFRLPLSPIEVMTEEQRATSVRGRRSATRPASSAATTRRSTAAAATRLPADRDAGDGPRRVPYMVNVIGLSMAAPTILNHGTEEQKRRFLPPLLAADEIWCQGFSEPNAGSDLASVQASAVRDGDNWIINGHKVWTSLAHFASWMIMLCRTSSTHKYNGLTYFIVPIADTKGVTVRPLIKITGETGFNEVLFEDVVVPDKLRVDEVGKGWTVAMTTLLYERGAAEGAGSGGGISLDERIDALVALARRKPRTADRRGTTPSIRDRVMQLAIRVEGMRQGAARCASSR